MAACAYSAFEATACVGPLLHLKHCTLASTHPLSPHSPLQSSTSIDGRFSITEGANPACSQFLLSQWHSIFLDAQLTLAKAGVGAARLPVLRAASLRYRRAMLDAIGRAEADKALERNAAVRELVEADVEDMRTVLALWHLAEIPVLHLGAEALVAEAAAAAGGGGGGGGGGEAGQAAELRGSPPLALLQWLREHFWGPTSEAEVLKVVNALRSPAAATAGAAAEREAWDVVVKLALEGEPNDAGRLLQLVAATRDCRETAQLAELLKGYPLLADALERPRAHAKALGDAWAQWRAGLLAFRRAMLASVTGARFLSHLGHLPGMLLDVLCGDSWAATPACSVSCATAADPCGSHSRAEQGVSRCAGLQLLQRHAGSQDRPYRTWMYEAGAQLLYGERCPLEYSAPALATLLGAAMARAGVDSEAEGTLLHAFVHILRGNTALALSNFTAFRQPWASAHFADLLWHCSSSSSSGSGSGGGAAALPSLWPPWDAALRPHLLLSHALSLPVCGPLLGRAALTYALAAFPQAVLRTCGIDPEDYAEELGVGMPADFTLLAERLAGTGAHTLSAAARTAKLALLSGASAGAGGVVEHLLVHLPVADERAALGVVRLCQRLGAARAADRVGMQWVRSCLARAPGRGGGLGSALAWAVGLRAEWACAQALRPVAARLKAMLLEAIQAGLVQVFCGGALPHPMDARLQAQLHGAAQAGAAQLPLLPVPWFPSSCLAFDTAAQLVRLIADAVAPLDDALAAVGHDAEAEVGGGGLSSSSAVQEACREEPVLHFALLLRRCLVRVAQAHERRALLSDGALEDLLVLVSVSAGAQGEGSLSTSRDSALLLRFAQVLGLLQAPQQQQQQQQMGLDGPISAARQALLQCVMEEEKALAAALFDSAFDAALQQQEEAQRPGDALMPVPVDAFISMPLGVAGLLMLKQHLQQ